MNPGSDEAIEHGCTCPVLDNGHGSDVIGDTRGFIYTAGCPVHDDAIIKQYGSKSAYKRITALREAEKEKERE